MNTDRFNEVVSDQINRCRGMLVHKAEEYATEDDRLHNFKQAAHLQGITPRQALLGMMGKHTVSIFDMGMSEVNDFTIQEWEEKISDHINYLLLLKAVIEEENPQAFKQGLTFHYDELGTTPPATNYTLNADGKLSVNS